MTQKRATSVWFTDGQRVKLRQLAEALGASHNATLGMLVDNAQIVLVPRQEAVSTLTPGQTRNNRHDAQNLTGSSVTAVSA
uniref:Uncharacterized protein n=1 Tax=uncultured bacterium A1Q1_fos_2004 TaxID=1256557 RepID=L7VTB6_9BACT|nr:hypothetical protein [uncultured bacterium A1Q1_fos_2004]